MIPVMLLGSVKNFKCESFFFL